MRQSVFFFNDTATTEIYTLSLHDALPIFSATADALVEPAWRDRGLLDTAVVTARFDNGAMAVAEACFEAAYGYDVPDRKSTRLNSSHAHISYAVFFF